MRRLAILFLGLSLALPVLTAPYPSLAQGQDEELQAYVDKAANIIRRMRSGDDSSRINYLLSNARGVMIFPGVLKLGFFFGGEGGNGLVVGRDLNGNWSDPAFVTIGSASFGLQFGGQVTEVVFIIMTQEALERAVSLGGKLGADTSVAAGPVGLDREFSTKNLVEDVYYYAYAKGAFAGISVEGSGFSPRDDLSRFYYQNEQANAKAIVLEGKYHTARAQVLLEALSRPMQ